MGQKFLDSAVEAVIPPAKLNTFWDYQRIRFCFASFKRIVLWDFSMMPLLIVLHDPGQLVWN